MSEREAALPDFVEQCRFSNLAGWAVVSRVTAAGVMQLAKYIILLWQGREHAVAFPGNIQHSAMFEYIRKNNPAARAISAGFFHAEPDAFWHGGESETLGLPSRPQDAQHIQSMLKSPDRRLWDLRVLVWEACESARRQKPQFATPGISMT